MLSLCNTWSTLRRVMASLLKYWGIGCLGAAVALFSVGVQLPYYEVYTRNCIWVAAGVFFVLAVYQFIVSYRLAEWEDYRNALEKENVGRPRPVDPLCTLLRKIFHLYELTR